MNPQIATYQTPALQVAAIVMPAIQVCVQVVVAQVAAKLVSVHSLCTKMWRKMHRTQADGDYLRLGLAQG